MPLTETCRQTPIANEPVVRGIGWCYSHSMWCGADIQPADALTDEAKAEIAAAHAESIAAAVASRRFSSQLLAWSRDATMMQTIPNEAMLAGVLVELCERLNIIEALPCDGPDGKITLGKHAARRFSERTKLT